MVDNKFSNKFLIPIGYSLKTKAHQPEIQLIVNDSAEQLDKS